MENAILEWDSSRSSNTSNYDSIMEKLRRFFVLASRGGTFGLQVNPPFFLEYDFVVSEST